MGVVQDCLPSQALAAKLDLPAIPSSALHCMGKKRPPQVVAREWLGRGLPFLMMWSSLANA